MRWRSLGVGEGGVGGQGCTVRNAAVCFYWPGSGLRRWRFNHAAPPCPPWMAAAATALELEEAASSATSGETVASATVAGVEAETVQAAAVEALAALTADSAA